MKMRQQVKNVNLRLWAAMLAVAVLLAITMSFTLEVHAQAEAATTPLPEVGFGGYEVLRSGDDWSVELQVQVLNGIAPVEDLKNLTKGGAVR